MQLWTTMIPRLKLSFAVHKAMHLYLRNRDFAPFCSVINVNELLWATKTTSSTFMFLLGEMTK